MIRTLILAALLCLVASTAPAQTLDAYQGYSQLPCPGSAQPPSCVNGTSSPCRFYLAEINKHWVFCDPLNNEYWFRGVTNADHYNDSSETQTVIQSKYQQIVNPSYAPTAGANSWTYNYAVYTVAFLKNIGFNAFSDGAIHTVWPVSSDVVWNSTDHAIPDPYKLPFNLAPPQITLQAMQNTQGCGATGPLKDLMAGASVSALTVGTWSGYNYVDYLDPQFAPCADNVINPAVNSGSVFSGNATGSSSPFQGSYLIYVTLDESDDTGFVNAGTDYVVLNADGTNAGISLGANAGYLALVSAPYQSSANPQHAAGGPFTYIDKETHTKVDFANLMAQRYIKPLCTGSASPISVCNGAGSVYSDTSVDPAATHYIGSNSTVTTALGNLNTAWGSNYTTFGTSDSHCTSNLATCLGYSATSTPGTVTYNSWLSAPACTGSGTINGNGFPATCCTAAGTGATCATEGTGLIDENGSDLTGHAWMKIDPCSHNASGVPSTYLTCTSSGRNATPTGMAADLDAYGYQYVYTYFNTLIPKFHTYAGYSIPTQMSAGGPAAPPHAYVLNAARDAGLSMLLLTMPWVSSLPADETAREAFVETNYGNHPWLDWPQLLATGDSSLSAMTTFQSGQAATSQVTRGTVYRTAVNNMLNVTSSGGDHPVIGLYWWNVQDGQADHGNNWGLRTRFDNPYDGVLSTTSSGTDSFGPLSFTTTAEKATMANADCLSSLPYPYDCCTGAGTGTCTSTAPANQNCTASLTPYPWCTGSHTGTANGNYGDFLDTMRSANAGVFTALAPNGGAVGGAGGNRHAF